MEYALVDGGVVVSVIVADSTFISEHGNTAKTQLGLSGSWVQCPAETKVGIGWTYADPDFTAPPPPEPAP